jgi:hypothetical protein
MPISTTDKKAVYELISDPVKWCEYYLKNPTNPKLPLRLRPYQKNILLCRENKKVLRMARRLGKTVAMVCEILWKATTHKNKIILVVTPYQSQVELIFNFIETMIQDVPELQGACKVRRSPFHVIEFNNKTKVLGFTAGTRSGQKGEGVRGQDATDMYLDEVDYMGSTAINAIKAIELSRPTVNIWASSTPTGKREQFYKWCIDKTLGFKEFHYTAEALPHWNEDMARRFRAECTDQNQFVQEYMAGWGHEAQGVFPPLLLDAAKLDYRYVDWQDVRGRVHPGCVRERRPENLYVLGIDWNGEGVGTRAVVLEWIISHENPKMMNKIRVFYHENIAETLRARGITHHSNLSSVDRVMELADSYGCSFIYLDKGYGHTNYELILERAKKRGQKNILNRYKEIDFNSRTLIRRPDGRMEEKWTKEFMVSSIVRFLENRMLILPEFEDDRYSLIGQMREYIVERETVTGRKKFTDVNEDSLVAMMLGIHAFMMEYSEFTQSRRTATEMGYAKGLRDVPVRESSDGEEKFKPMFQESEVRGPAFEEQARKHGLDYNYTRDHRDLNDRAPDKQEDARTREGFRVLRGLATPRRTNSTRRGGEPQRSSF